MSFKPLKNLLLATSMVALACPLAFAAGNGSNPNGKPFIELQGQIVEVQGKLSTIQDQVDALVKRVATVEERVAADQEAIANLQNQNVELTAQIAAYNTTAAALQTRVVELEAANLALQAQLGANAKTDESLQAQIAYNNGLISQLQQTLSGLSTLQDQVNNNSILIAALDQEIDGINSRLALKQAIITGTCPAGETIKQINSDGSIACQAVGGGVKTITMYTVYKPLTLSPNSKGSIELKCNVGDSVTGGGFVGGWNYSGMLVYESASGRLMSYPDSWDIWTVSGKNNGTYSDSLIARSRCMTVTAQ